MILKRLYATICVFSLSLFFVNSVSFYTDVIFETYVKFWVEQSDYGESESESESNVPVSFEEAEKHQVFQTYIGRFGIKEKLILSFYYIPNKWKNLTSKVYTPPPEIA